jgi:pimeloyl-ACP methyl ester carboxylesterase
MRGPVVLLHGLPFHKGLWGPIRAEPGAPLEVWAPDLPGYGDATRLTEAPSIAAHLRWLRQGLAQRGLEAGPGLHLVGHEYGGLLCAALAAASGAASLSLLSTSLGPGWLLARLAAAPGLQRWLYQRHGGRLYRDHAVGPEHRAAVAAAFPLPGTVDFADWMRQTGAALDLPTLWGLRGALARRRIPTRLLWGETDRTFPLAVGRQLAAALPPARLFTVPGARHLGLWTHPAEFARRLWAP